MLGEPAHPRNPAAVLDRRYWLALGLIAALIVFHQALVQPALMRLISDAPVINVAGRQRMLSQKLSKLALALSSASDPHTRRQRREELVAPLREWRTAHLGLQQGNSDLGLPGNNPAPVQQAFVEIERSFQSLVDAFNRLLDATRTDEPDVAAVQSSVTTILAEEPEFLTRMHAIVGQYEAEARERIVQMRWTGVMVMLAILIVLAAVQWWVVRPAVQLVKREFRNSEEQYERLVETMSDGLVTFDGQGRLQFANRRFRIMLGHSVGTLSAAGSDGPSLVGLPISTFLSDADRLHMENMGTGPVELRFQHAAGRRIETIVSPQRMPGSQPHSAAGWLLVVTDVTARKAVEQRSRELMDQLAHADRLRSMGEMAAGLAHEINQPLGAIANYAEGCLSRLTPEPDVDQIGAGLQGILRAAHRGGEIIRRAKEFSRQQPHCVSLESMSDLVREVEHLCQPEARQRGVFIETRIAADLPHVPVDAIQIQQVLINLIQNAFQAVEQVDDELRRILVAVRRAEVRPGDHWIQVTVTDSGPGVPAELASQMFEPFVTTRPEGTGMGLAISRSIVESHGGHVWIDQATARGGAQICFSLPVNPDPLPSVDAFRPTPEAVHA